MHFFAWLIAALCAIAAVVFAIMWWKLRSKAPARPPEASVRSEPDYWFAAEEHYTLLEKQQTQVAGSRYQYGIAENTDQTPLVFLLTDTLEHIAVGDSFSVRNNQIYKVTERSESAGINELTQDSPAAAANAAMPAATSRATDDFDFLDDGQDRTVMFKPGTNPLSDATLDPLSNLPYLQVTEGPDTGTCFPLPFINSSIGRSETSDICLSDDGASRLHCEVVFNRPGFVVRDAGSTNGTLCNGEEIDEHKLEFGDKIQVADTIMVFTCRAIEIKESDPPAAIALFEQYLDHEPEFLLATKNLAFLLERDIRRKSEAAPLWKEVARLEEH